MSIDVSAKNMRAIAMARKSHDSTCPGPATAVLMHPIEIERCGWEEGDNIAGLVLEADPAIGTGTFRVVCGLRDADDELEITEAVGEEVKV